MRTWTVLLWKGLRVVAGACFLCGCEMFYSLDGIGCEGRCADASTMEGGASVSVDAGGGDATVTTACGVTRGAVMVELRDFCIDRTETNTEQYAAFLADNGNNVGGLPAACVPWKTSFTPDDWANQLRAPQRPVVGIDWCDAEAYCRWAGKRLCGKIGGGATPFDDTANAGASEWQYACSRAGDARYVYPYGPDLDIAVCQANAQEPADVGTKPACVGGFEGIFDMSGNVWEWEDACRAETGKDDLCYSRGGSFVHNDSALSCGLFPFDSPRSSRHRDVGVRCCSR